VATVTRRASLAGATDGRASQGDLPFFVWRDMTDPKITRRKVTDYTPDPHNANKGTERGQYMVDTSVEQVGLARSIVAAADGTIPAGNKTLQAAVDAGITDVIEVETDGRALVVVKRTDWATVDSEAARKYAYLDNRASEVGLAWDAEQVLADLGAGVDLSDMFHDDEIEMLLAGLDGYDSVLGVEKGAQPNPRNLPIDAIFTISSAPRCCVAVDAGFKYGRQTSSAMANGEILCLYHDKKQGHEIVFLDNDYFNYSHAIHLECVKKYKPKYATVCDVMTRGQCAKDNITFRELDHILDWAEELAEYAENVIVIPKWDCIDRIPEKFMLGFSVPTSHGGTALPVEAFKGRRIHLLGGGWRAQLDYMAALGDDVVSFDNNYENVKCEYGQFALPDGEYKDLDDLIPFERTNGLLTSLTLGLGHIAAKVNELHAGSAHPA
jgi:hypothetical protein